MAYILEVEHFNTFIIKGPAEAWHVEESRIKGAYNSKSVDLGVRAHFTDQEYAQETRVNAIIFSGIYNSRTRTNKINQFPSGEDITKSVDIQYGSIQLLFAEDTALNIFQEEKVSWALIDKDAIYTAEGGRLTTAADNVIGDINYYQGNIGIGTHPESFAHYAGRKYFVDQRKGIVLRLSRDGLTDISEYGMRSYFRDNLSDATIIMGMWDIYDKMYVLSVTKPSNSFTVSFDEANNGWTSFFSYLTKEGGFSLDSNFYTFKQGDVYKHYSNALYNDFYGVSYDSYIEIVLNAEPSANKSFETLNYEGNDSWRVESVLTDSDTAYGVAAFDITNIDLIISAFKKQSHKFFSHLVNSSSIASSEVIFGEQISGVKGFYLKFTIKTSSTSYKELFSVASIYNINTY